MSPLVAEITRLITAVAALLSAASALWAGIHARNANRGVQEVGGAVNGRLDALLAAERAAAWASGVAAGQQGAAVVSPPPDLGQPPPDATGRHRT